MLEQQNLMLSVYTHTEIGRRGGGGTINPVEVNESKESMTRGLLRGVTFSSDTRSCVCSLPLFYTETMATKF